MIDKLARDPFRPGWAESWRRNLKEHPSSSGPPSLCKHRRQPYVGNSSCTMRMTSLIVMLRPTQESRPPRVNSSATGTYLNVGRRQFYVSLTRAGAVSVRTHIRRTCDWNNARNYENCHRADQIRDRRACQANNSRAVRTADWRSELQSVLLHEEDVIVDFLTDSGASAMSGQHNSEDISPPNSIGSERARVPVTN